MLVAVADLAGTLRRFAARGGARRADGRQVRLMTHADLTDADITAALDRIGPVERGRPGVRCPRRAHCATARAAPPRR